MFLVIPISCLALILLAPLAFLFSSEYYESSGTLQINRVTSNILTSEVDSIHAYYYNYVTTQVYLILSPENLSRAMADLSPTIQKRFPPLDLAKKLEVGPIAATHLIDITLQDADPEGLNEVVNAVMDAYVETMERDMVSVNERRLGYLETERDQFEQELTAEKAALKQLCTELGAPTLQQVTDVDTLVLSELNEVFFQARLDRLNKENTYRSIIERNEKLRELPMDAVANEVVYTDHSLWFIQSWTYENMQDLRGRIDGIAEGNPDREYVEERMAAMQQYEDEHRDSVIERTYKTVKEKREFELSDEQIRAEYEYNAAAETEDRIRELLERKEREAADIVPAWAMASDINERIAQLQQRIAQLDRRIFDLSVESKIPLRASVAQTALPALSPAGSNRMKFFALAFVLAFGSVGGVILLYDLLDNRVRGPQDLENAIGVRPLRPIPCHTPRAGGSGDFARVSLDAPESAAGVALRSLAMRLDHERRESGGNVLCFTGIDRGNGTSTTALNAAHVLAGFARNVVLIELSLDHPSLAANYGPAAVSGTLQDVLTGGIPLDQAILHDPERGVDLLFCGPGPNSDVVGLRLGELLQRLRSEYELVILNCSPVLASDLTEFAAEAADIAVLIIEGDYSLYREVRQAVELLCRLQVRSIVSVLTWGGHVGRRLALRRDPAVPWPLVKMRRAHEGEVPRSLWTAVLAPFRRLTG
jgi:uncharacterized protein involved in exopolysaccharide biosynthesis/Mrp family chromosome partitioning ATPase